ncbi:GNAT family N-acetyltransferase [Pseudomonas sp. ZB1P45]|uniref:GNAT family N-acetyltransferase n=1 Tax=Pseudomonas frigoris TaxID=3398356 RepID=UPI0039F0D2B4
MKQVRFQQIMDLPPQLLTLEKAAAAEGFRFLTRLIADWNTGANRFDAPGELLIAAYLDDCLIGIGGLSVDPYAQNGTGRLRRVYVAASLRGRNIGRALVETLLEHAAKHFRVVRLCTDTSEGDSFYLRCGFQRTDHAHATHTMLLGEAGFGQQAVDHNR